MMIILMNVFLDPLLDILTYPTRNICPHDVL